MNNPEIEHIVEQSVKIAREKKHEYVLLLDRMGH
jgi:hypothetical protein